MWEGEQLLLISLAVAHIIDEMARTAVADATRFMAMHLKGMSTIGPLVTFVASFFSQELYNAIAAKAVTLPYYFSTVAMVAAG